MVPLNLGGFEKCPEYCDYIQTKKIRMTISAKIRESEMLLENLLKKVNKRKTKFIVITGGVCSSIGKGILLSSIGELLKCMGSSISVIKMDPYLNVDPGTMSPLEHGEVFVTDDGAETDLDLGHYERILGIHLTKESSVSAGQIFREVLEGERKGTFLGKCIQLIPHVVDALKKRMLTLAAKAQPDFLLIEIGGTVGDIEGKVFLEAIRQLKLDLGNNQIMHAHLSYVPYLEWAHEIKTKPTQHSVALLRKAGIPPDLLFLRVNRTIDANAMKKLSIMCGISKNFIFHVPTCDPPYKLFIELKHQKMDEKIQRYFGFSSIKETDLSAWERLINLISKKKEEVSIGLIAKYVGSNDPYISVIEAIKAAVWACNKSPNIIMIEAEKLDMGSEEFKQLTRVDGIIVPGGFGNRGIEGKIKAAQWAREHNVPYLGLCLGMQVMLIEFARTVLGFKDASIHEHETIYEYKKETKRPIIALLEEQCNTTTKGSTMRLGAYPCTVKAGTKAYEAYRTSIVYERHRHRCEFNTEYQAAFENAGMIFSGIYEKKSLVEIAEIKSHTFMLGTQFHPEFLSRPLGPHPLFKSFMKATVQNQKTNNRSLKNGKCRNQI